MTSSDVIASLALLASVATWIYTVKGVSAARRATQLQIFDSLFREIRALDAEYIEKFREPGVSPSEQWFFNFFNTVEYLAFLLNNKLILHSELCEFYSGAVLHWYKTFEDCAQDRIKNDTKYFPEFRKLYGKSVTHKSKSDVRKSVLRACASVLRLNHFRGL